MKTIQVIGHLGKDAEIVEKKSKSDDFTIMFSVAHSETYKNKDGKEETKTDWFTCFKRYKKDPDKVLEVLKKGQKVYVSGTPNFSISNTKSGVFVNATINVHTLDFMSRANQEN